MEFLITAYDGKDDEALERRMSVRERHLSLAKKMIEDGSLLYGVAILDDSDKMIGSIMIVDFADKYALDEWLKIEPYVTGYVWKDIDVKPCRVPEIFH
jgi:uncharacterized protein YciI